MYKNGLLELLYVIRNLGFSGTSNYVREKILQFHFQSQHQHHFRVVSLHCSDYHEVQAGFSPHSIYIWHVGTRISQRRSISRSFHFYAKEWTFKLSDVKCQTNSIIEVDVYFLIARTAAHAIFFSNQQTADHSRLLFPHRPHPLTKPRSFKSLFHLPFVPPSASTSYVVDELTGARIYQMMLEAASSDPGE
jgi:hypothetical protein